MNRIGKDHSYKLASEKIRSKLSWEETKTLDEGIMSTVDWIDNNIDFLSKQSHEYIHKS